MNNDVFTDKVLGIQQPFFFPYLEYFALIAATDYWVVFDTPQYVRFAWVNRNRVLDFIKGTKYITVPVHKHKLQTATNKVKVHTSLPWRSRIIAQLSAYKKHAPYYEQVVSLLEETFNSDYEYISELNTISIANTCKYIGIDFKYDVLSEMDLIIDQAEEPGDWGIVIGRALGAKKYLNAFTGQKFIDRNKYLENDIDIKFFKYHFEPYPQLGRPFEPGLSIIDVMMFNSPDEIREMLNNYQLV